MKFHLKWRLFALCWLFPAAASELIWLLGRHRFSYRLSHLLGESTLNLLLLGLIFAGDRAFTVWEVNPSALRQRWFGFKTKEVAWKDVIRVGLADYNCPDTGAIQIEYVPAGATRTCWLALKVNPEEREEFIASLQQHATRATFDVNPNL